MDNLFAQKFLIGDPLNEGYDSSGINPNPADGGGIVPQGDASATDSINVKNVTATEKAGDMATSDPNYTPTPEDEGGESENDVTSAIPYLALGLIAAFLFIKFGKK